MNLLEPFKQATEELQSSSSATIYLVRPWLELIESMLADSENDHIPVVKEAKSNGYVYLAEALALKWTDIHFKIAMFLHPELKDLKKLTTIERDEVLERVMFK